MFWWLKKRRAAKLMTAMSEQEKIEVRALVVFHLSLAGQVHVMTTSQPSATQHADLFDAVGRQQGVSVGLLSSDSTAADRAATHRATIVVGPLSEFLADFTRDDARGYAVRDTFAVVEGAPDPAARQLLARYREIRVT